MKPKKVHWLIEAKAGRACWQYDFSAVTPDEMKEGLRIAKKTQSRKPLTAAEIETMKTLAAKTHKIPNSYKPYKPHEAKKQTRRTAGK